MFSVLYVTVFICLLDVEKNCNFFVFCFLVVCFLCPNQTKCQRIKYRKSIFAWFAFIVHLFSSLYTHMCVCTVYAVLNEELQSIAKNGFLVTDENMGLCLYIYTIVP